MDSPRAVEETDVSRDPVGAALRGLERLNRRIDASSDRELAASLLAAIAIAGSLVGFLTFPLPHPEGTDFVAPTISFLRLDRRRAAALALALLGVLGSDRRRRGARLARRHRDDALGPRPQRRLRRLLRLARDLRLLLPPPRWALAQIAWIAVLYGFAVFGDDVDGPFEQWINGVATTLGVGLLVLALRTRIQGLIPGSS